MELYDIAPLTKEIYTWIHTEEIPLRFSFSLEAWMIDSGREGHPTNIEVQHMKDANYTQYKLHCFLSKLNEKLKTINDVWSASTVPKRWKGRAHLFLQIYSAGNFVPLTPKLKAQIEGFLDECYDFYPEHCLIFSAVFPLDNNNIIYPRNWIETIVPYLIIPNRIKLAKAGKDLYHNINLFHANGAIYAKFEEFSPYEDIEDDIVAFITDQIEKLYNTGAIVLYNEEDKDFALKWGLVPRSEIYPSEDHSEDLSTRNDDISLYFPVWENRFLCKDRVRFLMERLICRDSILITVDWEKEGKMEKVEKSLGLFHINYKIGENFLIVWVDSYAKAELVVQTLYSS